MPRGRRKKVTVEKKPNDEDSYTHRTRRSSLRVNLSYGSNTSDTIHQSLKRTKSNNDTIQEELSIQNEEEVPKKIKKRTKAKEAAVTDKDSTATSASSANITVINAAKPTEEKQQIIEGVQIHSISTIKEKEQRLNRSCSQLKDIIMSKTKAFFDKENALAIKISEVLSPGSSTPSQKAKKVNDNRSPSVKVDIGKNDQIVMSGDGRKKNPVEVSSMSKRCSPAREPDVTTSDDDMDSNRSIGSTPKKLRIENSSDGNKSLSKHIDTSLRIPVARLFADNDPNNSLSEMEPVQNINSFENTDVNNQPNKSKLSNLCSITNQLNYTTSPILSQGTRKSRLSLKKKLPKPSTQNSRLSISTINESFISRVPFTCSSFIEKPDNNKDNNENETSKNSKTVELDENSKSKSSCKTINLDDNSTRTINIENSTTTESSCMDITTVSSSMPIVRRSFQQIIRKSLGFDNAAISHEEFNISKQKFIASSAISQCKESSRHIRNSETVQKTHDDTVDQETCTRNIVKSFINTNTLIDNTEQKENKKPNKQVQSKVCANQVGEVDDTVLIQNQSLTNVRSSMQVNTSLDSVRTLSDPTTIMSQEQQTVIKVSSQVNRISLNRQKDCSDTIIQEASNKNLEKESSVVTYRHSSTGYSNNNNAEKEIPSRQPSSSTVRTSMNVNTSLDSAIKSPVNKNNLDFDKILSMVEETTSQNNSKASSSYSLRTQSTDSESEVENISLMERIRNISATKNIDKEKRIINTLTKKSTIGKNSSINSTKRKSKVENETLNNSSKKKSICNKSARTNKKKSIVSDDNDDSHSSKKSVVKNISSSVKSNSTEAENNSAKSIDVANTSADKKKSFEVSDSLDSSKKSINASLNANGSSIIETTPYPASRSFLFKTMIRNNIAMNTIDPKRLMDLTDEDEECEEELNNIINKEGAASPNKYQSIYARKKTPSPDVSDTVILSSSDDSSNESDKESEKERVVIDESVNITKDCDKSRNNNDSHQSNKKTAFKRKLYPLGENSQLVSFSASETQELPVVEEIQEVKKKPRQKKLIKKKQEKKKGAEKNPQAEHSDRELVENDDRPVRKKIEKITKKPRKVKSKKIVVKKVNNLTMLDNLMEEEEPAQRLSERNSLREFDLKRVRRQREENARKSSKFVIVVTGVPKEEKDLVKSVVKSLGSAILQVNVTSRTTHVISSGIRTINLLKGILRGCWLLNMEWALKSLEAGKWLNAEPFEMSHFSKAVQENRRDRQLFGKGYVPELFVTCGPVYVENGTIPPTPTLKELIKIAGGRITENPDAADIIIGLEGVKEIWILDSITTGEIQSVDHYKRN